MRTVAKAGLVGSAFHLVPSTLVLGQWLSRGALPFGLCRWRGTLDGNSIAITFDDGPDPTGTPAILDRLDDLGWQATFFMLGDQVERWPELAAEVANRGHEIATHGYAHRHHLASSPGWIWRDLARAVRTMDDVALRCRWYRPTYGQVTGTTLVAARAMGLSPVLWSAWGREWTTVDPLAVSRRIEHRIGPGGIVLLHDSDAHGPAGMWRGALGALDELARAFERRRLCPVTMSQLVPGRIGRHVGARPSGSASGSPVAL